MNNPTLFECENLDIGQKSAIARGINMAISPGKIFFIRGKNGSGKSTLIKTMLKKIEPISGSINWNISNSSVSYLPQITNPDSSFSYTVKEILDLYEIENKYRKELPKGLESKKWINTSGGEKQKVMLLSRISKDTKMLILDEPFNHLDQESIESIKEMLINIVKNQDLSIVLVSHLNIDLPPELVNSLELKQ